MDKAIDRLNKQFTDYIIETGAMYPLSLKISRADYAELVLMGYFDFIPNDDCTSYIPTYNRANIELESK